MVRKDVLEGGGEVVGEHIQQEKKKKAGSPKEKNLPFGSKWVGKGGESCGGEWSTPTK